MVLVYHVIYQDHVINGLCTLRLEAPHSNSPSWQAWLLEALG